MALEISFFFGFICSIFLIDHAWTFDYPSARTMLESYPQLLERMCGVMDITEKNSEKQIKQVLAAMWKYISTYSVNSQNLVNIGTPCID